jgi:hypothetical protein
MQPQLNGTSVSLRSTFMSLLARPTRLLPTSSKRRSCRPNFSMSTTSLSRCVPNLLAFVRPLLLACSTISHAALVLGSTRHVRRP